MGTRLSAWVEICYVQVTSCQYQAREYVCMWRGSVCSLGGMCVCGCGCGGRRVCVEERKE